MNDIALLIERTLTGTIAAGDNVLFDSIVFSAGNLSYNSMTGLITFNEPGRYVFNWWTTTRFSSPSAGSGFALSSSKGDYLVFNTENKTDEAAGVGIIEVAATPISVSLVNAGISPATYGINVPVKAALMVVRDQIPSVGSAAAASPAGTDVGSDGPDSTVEEPFPADPTDLTEAPDLNEVYVQAGALEGDGTRENPFGSIQQGLAAVSSTGTVHILGGNNPATAAITVDTTGVTLQVDGATFIFSGNSGEPTKQ